MINSKAKNTSLLIVRIAMISALLTAGKFAISFIPNVEIVTIIIMVFSASFGLVYMLPATLVFCAMEVLIYGVQSWVLLYFIYWPLLAIISSILLKRKNLIVAIIVAIVFTFFFGLLSALADTAFCVGYLSKDDLWKYFVAYYLRGISFDIIHVVSNFVIVLVLFNPLVLVSKNIMPKAYGANLIGSSKVLNLDYVYEREERNNN